MSMIDSDLRWARRLPPITAAERQAERVQAAMRLAARIGRLGAQPEAEAPPAPAVSLDEAVDALGEIERPTPVFAPAVHGPLGFSLVVRLTAAEFGVAPEAILGASRHRPVARARQAAMALAHRFTRLTAADIGRRCGARDHTTVLHALTRAAELATTDAEFAEAFARTAARLERGRAG